MKPVDKRALKILFETYWSPAGWRLGERRASDSDFEYAKAHRMMFDPISPTHDETISRLCAVSQRLSARRVADGFLASLSTRRLEWRSALGSLSVARRLPEHEAPLADGQCRICGLYSGEQDLNVVNFERYKWGGVRHSDPAYGRLDLELFEQDPPPAPTADDCRIFRDLIAAIAAAPATVTSAALQSHLPKTLKSNKSERDQIVGILGLCGILGTPKHPGFFDRFVPFTERALPNRHFVDMTYPACWWSGAVGMNKGRLHELFGHAL